MRETKMSKINKSAWPANYRAISSILAWVMRGIPIITTGVSADGRHDMSRCRAVNRFQSIGFLDSFLLPVCGPDIVVSSFR